MTQTDRAARDQMVERIAENSSSRQKLEPPHQQRHFQITWKKLLLFVVSAGLGYIVVTVLQEILKR